MSRFHFTLSFRAVTRLFLVAAAAMVLGRITLSATTDGEKKKASCAYNLMQFGKAIRMFSDDHRGYISPLSGRVDRQAKEGADNAQRLKEAYAPYVQDPEIWYCPGDPYAKIHTLQPPDRKPPQDQPVMRHDHYYMSYQHVPCISQEEAPARLDAVRMVKKQNWETANLPGGVWVATPDMIHLMLDDGLFHGPPVAGMYGNVYGRNYLFRDGHVKFETEETMYRPKQ